MFFLLNLFMRVKRILILFFILSTNFAVSTDFKLNLFEIETQARCLDGSKYGVYKSKGFSE